MFTQANALTSRGRRPIDVAHDAAVICLPADMKFAHVVALT